VALTSKKLIGVRDPNGVRPLVMGELDGAVIFASETCALDIIGADVLGAARRVGSELGFPADLDTDEALRRFHSFYGHPDEIIAALRNEKVLPVATDLITQFNPAIVDHDNAIRALELIATEIAPALGWKPARQTEPSLTGVRP